jgi:hypothetical protein
MDVWEIPQSSRSELDRGFLMDVGPTRVGMTRGDRTPPEGFGTICVPLIKKWIRERTPLSGENNLVSVGSPFDEENSI